VQLVGGRAQACDRALRRLCTESASDPVKKQCDSRTGADGEADRAGTGYGMVLAGAAPAIDGVIRWRRIDLRAAIAAR
jgi:hypothetical protein